VTSSLGSLIDAAAGTGGGVGARRTSRSGLAWYQIGRIDAFVRVGRTQPIQRSSHLVGAGVTLARMGIARV
jgi:hypothetical protein